MSNHVAIFIVKFCHPLSFNEMSIQTPFNISKLKIITNLIREWDMIAGLCVCVCVYLLFQYFTEFL